MAEEKQKIVKELGKARLIIVDSNGSLDERNNTDVIVAGSHCGRNGGEYLASLNVKGIIGNDAGMGKGNAGIAGLEFLDRYGIPGAAVSCMSAHIGIGMSTYEQGKLSAANEAAKKLGITVGMSAKEAADKMLEFAA